MLSSAIGTSELDQRLAAFRTKLSEMSLDAFVVPRADLHQGSLVAACDERLAFMTGFTGSVGLAIITDADAAVFVSQLYPEQLDREAPPAFEREMLTEADVGQWLARSLQADWQVGFDPRHLSIFWHDRLAEFCNHAGARLVAAPDNPVDAIWHDRPSAPDGRIEALPEDLAGVSAASKLEELTAELIDKGAQIAVETRLDNVAWLMNLRGCDVPLVQVPHAALVLEAGQRPTLLLADHGRLERDGVRVPTSVDVTSLEALPRVLGHVGGPGKTALLDETYTPVLVRDALRHAGTHCVLEPSATALRKTRKNATELAGMRACHRTDAVAWFEMSAWLAKHVPEAVSNGASLSEWDAALKMIELRRRSSDYLEESYHPISAVGSNATMSHYHTPDKGSSIIRIDAPFLFDTGAQYINGTTDTTRTYVFSDQPPDGFRQAYTAVFKGFFSLATTRFAKGTRGDQLDAIARRPIWDVGLDYDHATGHCVGHRLSIHERPIKIEKTHNPFALDAGMVVTIEPGFYRPQTETQQGFGIRIENIFEIVEDQDGFLRFETLTFAPIDTRQLDRDALSSAERGWLNTYHETCLAVVEPRLSEAALDWARNACAPV